jgi:hypothetical protein
MVINIVTILRMGKITIFLNLASFCFLCRDIAMGTCIPAGRGTLHYKVTDYKRLSAGGRSFT